MSPNLLSVALLTILSYDFAISISKHPIVLVISYDGFRHDYIDGKGSNPILKSIREQGTYADFVNNVFITKTYPNHQSISTGLYPESHGILGNTIYDPVYGRGMTYSYEFWHFSDDILPIWIANEKKGDGRYSGVMMWPSNEFNYSGIYPTHSKPWSKNYPWEKRVDGVIEWITDPKKPANLVMLYIEEPDAHGHTYGPEAPEMNEELKQLDKITLYLMKRLNETRLADRVNIFFLSDHGMIGVAKKDVIDLRKYISSDKYDKYEGSPTIQIYPKKGFEDEVYDALKKAASENPFSVYKREEIPERWHYRDNRRAPPLFVVADAPHVFHDFYEYVEWQESVRNFTASDNDTFGVHGYDTTVMEMKPYFIATGPLVRKRHKVEPFETVDLFSLWAHILGFPEYAAATNGSFDRVRGILATKSDAPNGGNVGGALLGALLVAVSLGISIFFIQRRLRLRRKLVARRMNEEENWESRQRLLENAENAEEEEA